MQVSLNQREIEVALKAFVVNQGINLTGKTVEIAFTAGRKESGISAELNIEDRYLGEPSPPNCFPTLVHRSDERGYVCGVGVTSTPMGVPGDEPEVPQEPDPAEREDALVPEPLPVAKTTSLFG